MARSWLRPFLAILCGIPVIGTLLSFSRRTHWIFRVWDFPRVQIAAIAALSAMAYRMFGWRRRPVDRAIVGASGAVIAYQLFRVHAYTPLVSPTVKRARNTDVDNRILLMITNVLMENEEHDLLLESVKANDPDLVLALEVDRAWDEALAPLADEYPHSVHQAQDNYYGMLLLSRLELIEPRVEFIVQDDIPSIHTRVRLRSGREIVLHGLHPRPPEPIRDQPSSPRDADLVLMGRRIGEHKGEVPTIVAGDLNDVAWSTTSELFVRLSGLLDPRTGRGFFNSYNANNPLFRYSLDHVFHSIHFELVRIERLPSIGSDHFPILIELQYSEDAERTQEPTHTRRGDQHKASEKLAAEDRDKATGDDRPRGE